MNHQKPQSPEPALATDPRVAAPRSTVAALRQRPPSDTRSAVLLSLIVCPRGGVGHHRHGQGRGRPAA
jgi:hypothetical protein